MRNGTAHSHSCSGGCLWSCQRQNDSHHTITNPKNTVALCCGSTSRIGLWLLCIMQDLSAVPSWSETSCGDHKINGIGMNWIPNLPLVTQWTSRKFREILVVTFSLLDYFFISTRSLPPLRALRKKQLTNCREGPVPGTWVWNPKSTGFQGKWYSLVISTLNIHNQ